MKKSVVIAVLAFLVGGFVFFHYGKKKRDGVEKWPAGVDMVCIVPWKAGGSADTMARQLLKYWEPELGTHVTVENRDGKATLAGTEYFLRQPDDGTRVYVGTQMYMSAGVVLQGADYSMDDFEVVNFQQFDPITVAVHADSPFHTFQDLVDEIKKRPGMVKCGLIHGGAPHLGAVVLKEMLGLEYEDVTFDSGNAYRTALLGHQVDFIVSNANGDRAIQGKVRILAVADDKRSGIWPDSPTFNEVLGIGDFPKLGSARFIAVRSGVRQKHPARFDRLVETYKKAFENPEYAAFRQSVGEAEVSAYRGPEESNRMNRELHALLGQYKARIEADK